MVPLLHQGKMLLGSKGLEYEEKDVTSDLSLEQEQ